MLEIINNKELKLIEILAITINLFKKNFNKIIIVVALLFFPISILNAMIMERMNDSVVLLKNLSEAEGTMVNFDAFFQAFWKFMGSNMLQMMVLMFLEPVGMISIAKVAKGQLCNETIDLREIIGESMNCLGKIILTGVIFGVLVFLATFCFIIPAFYLGVIWSFYVYIIGLRGYKGWEALTYSKKLIDGRFWRTVGYLFVIIFIAVVCNSVIGGIFYLLPTNIATDILYNALTSFPLSFECIALTVLFMNREAFLLGKKYSAAEYVTESTVDEDV